VPLTDRPTQPLAVSSAIDVAVVGAGAAGLATAILVARRAPGLHVAVFDGSSRPGAKILVSGGGRCNLTNRVVQPDDYCGGDRRFIASVLRAFPVSETVRFFEELGVAIHEEDGGKIFPDSGSARTVLGALRTELDRCGVPIHAGHRVRGLRGASHGFELAIDGHPCHARFVVLATGGCSLPKTGSDGGGFALAESFGHTVVPTTPALVPLVLDGQFHKPLSGVSHEVSLSVTAAGRSVAHTRGSLLWTHFGVSGPAVLDASRHWHRAVLETGGAGLRLSFVPGADVGSMEQRWLLATQERPGASVRAALAAWTPGAVADAVLGSVGFDGTTRLAHLGREPRRQLSRALTDWDVPVKGSRGYNYAEVTAGGVALSEVDRGTLESRCQPGVFFVGEVLDVDGRLGGFNFQWAWSSAWVAARSLGTRLSNRSDHDRTRRA
jgi:predicted Rossmann fold flavoprotein